MGSFSVFQWVITGGIFYLLFSSVRGMAGKSGKISENGSMICPNCGTRGNPKIVTKGSIAIEIVLWLCLLVPGLIYSIWRLTTRHPACPSCNQTGMIGVETPNGKMLAEKFHHQ